MILEQRVEAPWAGDALRIWNAASNAEYLPQCHGVRQRGVVWRVARSLPSDPVREVLHVPCEQAGSSGPMHEDAGRRTAHMSVRP